MDGISVNKTSSLKTDITAVSYHHSHHPNLLTVTPQGYRHRNDIDISPRQCGDTVLCFGAYPVFVRFSSCHGFHMGRSQELGRQHNMDLVSVLPPVGIKEN